MNVELFTKLSRDLNLMGISKPNPVGIRKLPRERCANEGSEACGIVWKSVYLQNRYGSLLKDEKDAQIRGTTGGRGKNKVRWKSFTWRRGKGGIPHIDTERSKRKGGVRTIDFEDE